MARDFKSFLKGKGKNVDPEIEEKIPPEQRDTAYALRDQIAQYEGKSENELMEQLFAAVEQGKRDGTFSKEALEQFVGQVAPMMDAAQRQKLQNLMQQIE